MSVHAQDNKYVNLFAASVATNATTLGTVDTLEYDYATFVFHGDTTSTNPSALRLLEGTNTSVATTITGATGDSDFTIPAADTTNGIQVVFHVDLRARQRYIGLETQAAGAAQICSGWAILSRAHNAPITDAERVGPGTVEVVTL